VRAPDFWCWFWAVISALIAGTAGLYLGRYIKDREDAKGDDG
jgi:hypothetical protein